MTEPIHIISLGAGVQSSTMALKAKHLEIEPMPLFGIFADTQAEPQSVYDWLDWLEKQLPFPVYRVTAGSIREKALRPYWSKKNNKRTITGIPAFTDNGGMMPKQCTQDFKIAPIRREIRRLVGRQHRIVWKGISIDEPHRIKPSFLKCETFRYPLIEQRTSRWDCIAWMKLHGYPEPPRSACDICPFHSDNEWRRLRDKEPRSFQNAVEFEIAYQRAAKESGMRFIPFLHRSRVPLDQVDFETDEDHGQQVMFGNECEGLCGV